MYPECEKLNEKTKEWNTIYPFLEWLQENHMCVAEWKDPKADYENLHTGEIEGTIEEVAPYLLEHPYETTLSIENLLYKYFQVDPAKLEEERRVILENLGKE